MRISNMTVSLERRYPALPPKFGICRPQGGPRNRQRIINLGRYYLRIRWSTKS